MEQKIKLSNNNTREEIKVKVSLLSDSLQAVINTTETKLKAKIKE